MSQGTLVAGDFERVETTVVCATTQMRLFSRPGSPGRPFTISAYAKDADGKTVRLELPHGFEFVECEAEQPVQTPKGKIFATVTWKIKASKQGDFKVKAIHSDGTTAEESISIFVGGFD